MMRVGTRYINDPNAASPEPVAIAVHAADYTEEWTDGLQIYHNPSAEHPLEPDAFPGAVHHRLEHGMLVSYSNGSSLFGTRTFFTT
jgi:hypothetical protein